MVITLYYVDDDGGYCILIIDVTARMYVSYKVHPSQLHYDFVAVEVKNKNDLYTAIHTAIIYGCERASESTNFEYIQ